MNNVKKQKDFTFCIRGDAKHLCWPTCIFIKTARSHSIGLQARWVPSRSACSVKGRTAGSVSQRCGWPAACPPINIMQVCCCDLPSVSLQLRSITWTDCTPFPQPPFPHLHPLWRCLFNIIIIYPPFERAVSARPLKHYRNLVDKICSVGFNRIRGSLV